MNFDVKKTFISLIFGCSLGFTLMALCLKLGVSDNAGVRIFIGFMPALWVVNFRNKIFK